MPVVLRNKTNSVEIDINPNLKYEVSKGGYDVIYEDTGATAETPAMVRVVLKTSSIVNTVIDIDWRSASVMPDETTFTSAEELRDTLLSWNIPKVSINDSVLATGAATAANQINGDQKALIKQEVVADANNSSDVNLAAGNLYAFTGTGTSTLGVAGIQVSLHADQNCTIYVDQSPDNINWDLSDEYKYYADGNFGITVQAISSYVRVRVTTNSLTTTEFRLQTALCPVVEAVPRSLDEYGSFKTTIRGNKDFHGFIAQNTPLGEARTIIPTRLVGAIFDGATLDANFWLNAVANNGTVVQGGGIVTLSTNITSANGSAKLWSVRRARYVSASGMVFKAVARLTGPAVDNKRRFGVAFGATMPTISDGAYFELNGTGATSFSVVLMNGGVEDRVSSGDFNGDMGKTYLHNLVTFKTYEIYYTSSHVYFVINGELLHTFSATIDSWADTMSHYIYMDNVNSNQVSTNNVIDCKVASIQRLGQLNTQPIYYHIAGNAATHVLKLGPGILHKIVFNNTSGTNLTIIDNVTGVTPVAGVITTTAACIGSWEYNLPFNTGLIIVTTGNSLDATIIYE